MIEKGSIKSLPDRNNKVFDRYYNSASYIFVSTQNCALSTLERLVYLIDTEGLSWLKPLPTSTSRSLFVGHLDDVNKTLPDVIFKKSRFIGLSSDPKDMSIGDVANEVRSNRLLNAIIQKHLEMGDISPPKGFDSCSISVEKPLGILTDKAETSRYAVFLYEVGFDFGEILQYVDPPMQGAVNYNPEDWKIFCGIKDIIDKITQIAYNDGLIMPDFDVHQVLYRTDVGAHNLALMLIDSERFKIENKN